MISSPNHGVAGAPIFADQRIEDCAFLHTFGALEFIKSACGSSGFSSFSYHRTRLPRRRLREDCAILLLHGRSLTAIHLLRLSKTEQIVAVTNDKRLQPVAKITQATVSRCSLSLPRLDSAANIRSPASSSPRFQSHAEICGKQ